MKVLVPLLFVLVGALALRAADPLDLDYKIELLTYGGYTFQKVFDSKTEDWTLEARKGQELVHTFGSAIKPEWIRMGLAPLVQKGQEQIVLSIYSGGAHCCSTYWVVSVEPTFRLILDTSEVLMNDFGEPRDIDGDGSLALSIGTTTFDYFGGPFAWSPQVVVWFKYDVKADRFVPANDLCFAAIQKDIDSEIGELRSNAWKQDSEPEAELRRLVLNVVIAYLYAGHDWEAWEFFDREFKEANPDEMRAEVIETAKQDPFYQELLQRYQSQKTR